MSAHLSLSAAVIALLVQAPAPSANVVRGRKGPMPTEWPTMIVVRTERSQAESSGIGTGPTDWTTLLAIEIHARGTTTLDAEAAVDALLEPVYARLAGAGVISPGVQSVVVDPEIEWELFEGEREICAVTLSLRILHRTQGANLTAWS